MNEPSETTARWRRLAGAALAGLALIAIVWGARSRTSTGGAAPVADETPETRDLADLPDLADAAPPRPQPLPAPVKVVPPAPPPPAALEYMGDGVPIMPARPDQPHPDLPMHPHPITAAHRRIYRENSLLYQLNEAMDGREVPRLRALLREYRDEYPEDPHTMQEGYALIADCLEHPSDDLRARARRFFAEERASTLRRFVLRHCLDGAP